MHPATRTVRAAVPALLWLVALAAVALACGQSKPAAANVRLDPVNQPGVNPFTPAVGNDINGVRPPPGAGGTFPGNTVGLFGGTNREGRCDGKKMVAFLNQHPDKAAAFAQVLDIRTTQISSFVGSLTPAILRSDTRVTNHGFANGKATVVPAVLQAGTAVLVTRQGVPVVRCMCGNPLTAPAALTNVTFVGQKWTNFQETEITVIQSANVTINQFVMVNPSTGDSFTRPAGTTGGQDGPVTPAPRTSQPAFGPPAGSSTPPATTAPTSSAPASPAPTGGSPSAPGTVIPAPPPGGTASAPTAGTGSPSPGGPSPTTVSPTTSPAASPTTSPTASPTPVSASWVVGDCFVSQGTAHAVVRVRNNDSRRHTFDVTVELGPAGEQKTSIPAGPGETAEQTITADAGSAPDGPISCSITSIVDENGQRPTAGPPIPPPPDTRPSPTPSETTESPTPSETTESPTPTEETPSEPPTLETPSIEPS